MACIYAREIKFAYILYSQATVVHFITYENSLYLSQIHPLNRSINQSLKLNLALTTAAVICMKF